MGAEAWAGPAWLVFDRPAVEVVEDTDDVLHAHSCLGARKQQRLLSLSRTSKTSEQAVQPELLAAAGAGKLQLQ